MCVCVLHINLSGPNHSAVADPVRGLLDSREKKQPAQDKNKRPSSIEKKKQDGALRFSFDGNRSGKRKGGVESRK